MTTQRSLDMTKDPRTLGRVNKDHTQTNPAVCHIILVFDYLLIDPSLIIIQTLLIVGIIYSTDLIETKKEDTIQNKGKVFLTHKLSLD